MDSNEQSLHQTDRQLLLIDRDKSRAVETRLGLEGLSWKTKHVGTVFGALTALERSTPSMILVRNGRPGLPLERVSMILRRATVGTDIPLVLLSPEPVGELEAACFDQLIRSDRPSVIAEELEQDASTRDEPGDVEDLLSSFAAALATGRLIVRLPGDEHAFSLLFEEGKVIQVSRGLEEGMALLSALLQDDLAGANDPGKSGLWYRFENISHDELASCARTFEPMGLDALRKVAGIASEYETQELEVSVIRQRRRQGQHQEQ